MGHNRSTPNLQLLLSFLVHVLKLFWISHYIGLPGVAEAVCGPDNATPYVPINSSLYDMEYSSITSDNKHPLGFYKETWHYNQDRNPCIKITAPAANQRRVEIMVETIPEARLCFKDQNSVNQCFQGRGRSCRETPGNVVYVEFLCDSRCEEADVTFWYRLVMSPLNTEQDLDEWCFQQPNRYPQDLATLPPGVTLPTVTTPGTRDTGGGARTGPWAGLWVATLVLARMCS